MLPLMEPLQEIYNVLFLKDIQILIFISAFVFIICISHLFFSFTYYLWKTIFKKLAVNVLYEVTIEISQPKTINQLVQTSLNNCRVHKFMSPVEFKWI